MKPSPVSNNLVERAAQRALLKEQGSEPDLMRDGIPFKPALWHIVVWPLKPKTMTEGGIEVVDAAQEAESFQMTIGKVIAAGPEALKGKTTSGIDLSNFLEGITTNEQLIGKDVIYQLHTGRELTLRRTGETIRIMKVTDLLGVTDDPYAWKFYI